MHGSGSVLTYVWTIVFEQPQLFRRPGASFQCGKTQATPALKPVDSEWPKSLSFSFNFSRVGHFPPGVALQPLGFFDEILEVPAQ